MADQEDLLKAVKESLQFEKDAMDFYTLCEARSTKPETRAFFRLLASEECDHARMFHRITGEPGFEEYVRTNPDADSPWLSGLRKMESDFSEPEAMRFAMEMERELEDIHRKKADEAADPVVKAIYELNARETRDHLEMIGMEYSRVMGMANEGDIDSFRG